MHKIIDKQNAPHYLWGGNCDSWVLVDSEGLSVKQENMPPNTREKLHFHSNSQQFFFVVKGIATFYIKGEKTTVQAQQGIHILPNMPHCIANETQEAIEFLVVSQPSTNNDRTVID